jgi:Ca2+-binding EF-hand superfamily protein
MLRVCKFLSSCKNVSQVACEALSHRHYYHSSCNYGVPAKAVILTSERSKALLPWSFSLLYIPIIASTVAYAESDSEDQKASENSFLSLKTRQRLFFAYEKRIRDNSPLDKVFDYFSSKEEGGIKVMTPQDLLRAVVPTYPSSKSSTDRAGSLPGERAPSNTQISRKYDVASKFFLQFDLDGDGNVNYLEFLLLLTMVSISKDDVAVIFDIVDEDGSGAIDIDEFNVIMRLMTKRAHMHSNQKGSIFGRSKLIKTEGGSGGKVSEEVSAGSLLVSFFGKDGKGKMSLRTFKSFLGELHDELIKLEFRHYMPDEDKCIPGIDFARSLAASASLTQVYTLLDKIEVMDARLLNAKITFKEFEDIYRMQCNLRPLKVALEFLHQLGRPVTRQEMSKIVTRFTNVRLSDQVLDIIMVVFGDGNQGLDVVVFIDAMARKLNSVHASKLAS